MEWRALIARGVMYAGRRKTESAANPVDPRELLNSPAGVADRPARTCPPGPGPRSALLPQLIQRFQTFALQDGPELGIGTVTGRETVAVLLPQRPHEGVAALLANLTVLVAHAAIEASWEMLRHVDRLREKVHDYGLKNGSPRSSG